ncbi:hypothetical protein AAFF_G00052120 [Aldrovandia affinis]|uniref:Uncharacterized protein n=1 Tax=Aldrovandia affinis TaxID=143900 RepID=A0AAD7WYX9_9TELE|nr:hypothetical protein AAFF_G00052120 [Aldrovandia affinis]
MRSRLGPAVALYGPSDQYAACFIERSAGAQTPGPLRQLQTRRRRLMCLSPQEKQSTPDDQQGFDISSTQSRSGFNDLIEVITWMKWLLIEGCSKTPQGPSGCASLELETEAWGRAPDPPSLPCQ